MRLDRRPLLDTRGDAALYVERLADRRTRSSLDLGLNVLVHGSHGSGRTSLGRHLQWLARQPAEGGESTRTVHRLSAASVTSAEELLGRLLTAVTGPGNAGESDALDMVEMLRQAAHEGGGRPLFVLDDVTTALGRALFGALRDEVWAVEASWLVMCLTSDVDALLMPPVDAFFEVVIPLADSGRGFYLDMVSRRLDGESVPFSMEGSEWNALVDMAGNHPRRLLDLVRAVVVDGESVQHLLIRSDRLDHLQHSLDPQLFALLEELDTYGPAGPSEEYLQQRMGLSRPRLAKLLHDLRDRGLVEETTAPSDGPGRPRVLYRTLPVPAEPDVEHAS